MWYDDLCEYYNISPQEAEVLGTRKKGRKPNLPGSATCQPVSGLTFEEIWDSKPRETSAQIFDFYKEISEVIFYKNKYGEKFGLFSNDNIISKQIFINEEFDLEKLKPGKTSRPSSSSDSEKELTENIKTDEITNKSDLEQLKPGKRSRSSSSSHRIRVGSTRSSIS